MLLLRPLFPSHCHHSATLTSTQTGWTHYCTACFLDVMIVPNCGQYCHGCYFCLTTKRLERGFSANRHIVLENMAEGSYVALRFICDHVNSIGGDIGKFPMTPALLTSGRSSHIRYQAYLEEQRKSKKLDGKLRKRAQEVLDELRKKRKLTVDDIEVMTSTSYDLSLKVEDASNSKIMISLLIQL